MTKALVTVVLIFAAACGGDTSKCVENNDIPACNRACVGDDSGEACAKRLELAIAACEGTRTHPHWKTQEAACAAQQNYMQWALRKR